MVLALKTPRMFCCAATRPVDTQRAGRSIAGGGNRASGCPVGLADPVLDELGNGKFHLAAAGGWTESLCAAAPCQC